MSLHHTQQQHTGGPIAVHHETGTDHVVHGTYGFASINGRLDNHVTVTWTQALPYSVVFTFTDPRTGGRVDWHVSRDVLRDETDEGNTKVETVGEATFFDLRGRERQSWFRINAAWLREFRETTEKIVPPATEWDTARFWPAA